jgi:hypothetical protein
VRGTKICSVSLIHLIYFVLPFNSLLHETYVRMYRGRIPNAGSKRKGPESDNQAPNLQELGGSSIGMY